MSYDVYIGSEGFNMTWNVGKLFYDHIPMERAKGGLSELDGLTGKQASQVLADAFERINRTRHKTARAVEAVGEPEFCALYDAPNGWGSTVGALIFLAQILGACALNPRRKVRVL